MKDQLKARLFGIAMTLSLFALIVVPDWTKRW
jgi:hypothetical protein